MIDRITRKAELLDEGKLHAMFEHGKLRTAKPSTQPTFEDRPFPSPSSPPGSPQPGSGFSSVDTYSTGGMKSPVLDAKGFGRYNDITGRTASVRSSQYMPSYQQAGYQGPEYARPGTELPSERQGQHFVSELPGSFYQPQQQGDLYPLPLKPQGQAFRSELPGDTMLQPQQYAQDTKPAPPNATHPAYQAYPNRSPHPSPGLPNCQIPNPQQTPPLPNRNSSASCYHISNPDKPDSPRSRPNSYQNNNTNNSNSVQDWQRTLHSDQPTDSSHYRNSLPSSRSQSIEQPDHQRFSNLSIQQNDSDKNVQPQQSYQAYQDRDRDQGLGLGLDYGQHQASQRNAKCPVCGLFEGDPTAVSHHVSKAHFDT